MFHLLNGCLPWPIVILLYDGRSITQTEKARARVTLSYCLVHKIASGQTITSASSMSANQQVSLPYHVAILFRLYSKVLAEDQRVYFSVNQNCNLTMTLNPLLHASKTTCCFLYDIPSPNPASRFHQEPRSLELQNYGHKYD